MTDRGTYAKSDFAQAVLWQLAMATAPQPRAVAQEETTDQEQAAVLPIVERLMQSAD